MGMLHLLPICLVACSIICSVESAVRITTIPREGPFRPGQTVQFSCEVESALSAPVTYQWKALEKVYFVNQYFNGVINITYYEYNLRYCWYFCTATLNGRILGTANKLVEVHGFLLTDEPIVRSFSLRDIVEMKINISDNYSQFISSLAWYHNGTKITSDDRFNIANRGTSLTVSNMIQSDAGKYEARINSIEGSSEICDINILPMLENLALHAPVTFLLQESTLPTYNPEDVILDYVIPAYQGSLEQSITIDNIIRINVHAVQQNNNIIYEHFSKDGFVISGMNAYNNTVFYDNEIIQSLKISYNNTEDIAGHYLLQTDLDEFDKINQTTCPSYYNYLGISLQQNSFIPVFTLYWNIISHSTITLNPRFGNMLGGTGILIETTNPTSESESITCTFGSTTTVGRRLNSTLALCVSPLLQKSGFIPLQFHIGDNPPFESRFLSISPENAHAATFSGSNISLLFSPGDQVTIKWSPQSLIPSTLVNNVTVDISVQLQFYNSPKFELTRLQPMKSNTANDGEENIIIENVQTKCFSTIAGFLFEICPISFKISISKNQYLPSDISIWTGMAYIKSGTQDSIVNQCEMWRKITASSVPLLERLPSCPPNQPLATFDRTYQRENMVSYITFSTDYHNMFMDYFHPGINACYRQSVPNNEGAGQQCCYHSDSVLVKKPVGGSADNMSPLKNYYVHVIQDLVPYILCCKGENFSRCDDYFEGRPAGSERGYLLPIPACVYGDPHIVTLDGHKYTFNGKGEFILIQTESNIFSLQGRMEQVLDNQGSPAPGTVFTAIVAKQLPSDTAVQFEVDKEDNSLHVLVNEEEMTFGDVAVLEFEDVALLDKGNKTVQALFSSGANVEISVKNGIIAVMLVGLPKSMKRTTRGLMGSFNDIVSDDLVPRNGEKALPLDDTLENIHRKFGITWIIDQKSDSLFTYGSGDSWSKFYFPNFLPMFTPTFTNATLEIEAKKMCGDDKFCLFDIAATKRVEIGAATMEGQEMLNTITEMSKPITCDPLCENGVCMENNTCRCSAGFRGDRCTESVLEECEVNMCQNNGTCSKQALTYTCTCLSQFTGSFCQNKVPPFKIRILNSSPRVIGRSVFAEFVPSKTATSNCTFDGETQNCSDGTVKYENVSDGQHIFRIISVAENKESDVVERRIYIGPCAIHLINNGVTVNEEGVTIEFVGTSDIKYFRCRLDGFESNIFCRSPLRYKTLAPGQHELVIRPQRCMESDQGRLTVKFEVEAKIEVK